jgi:hypothetical protein
MMPSARPAGADLADLADLVHSASSLSAGGDLALMLPVTAALRPLLPGGALRRGSTIAVTRVEGSARAPGVVPSAASHQISTKDTTPQTPGGVLQTPPVGATLRAAATRAVAARSASARWGSTSLMLALLAEASRAGSWCAIVGMPELGVAAAAELGVALERLALVPFPGPGWPDVVAALLDGFDVVTVSPSGPVTGRIASQLSGRARRRSSVLMSMGSWTGADMTLAPVRAAWQGLGSGHGRLKCRHMTVVSRGRGAATRPEQVDVWLPAPTGEIQPATAAASAGAASPAFEATDSPHVPVVELGSRAAHLRVVNGG